MGRKFVTVLTLCLFFQFLTGHPAYISQELNSELLDDVLDNEDNTDFLKANNLDGLQSDEEVYLSRSFDNEDFNEYNVESHNIQKREVSDDEANEETVQNENVDEEKVGEENLEETNSSDPVQEETDGDAKVEEGNEEGHNAENTDEQSNTEETVQEETVQENNEGLDAENTHEETPQENINEETPEESTNEETSDEPTNEETPEEPTNEETPEEPTNEETPNEETPEEPTNEETPNEETPEEHTNEETPNEETPQEPTNEETPEEPTNEETPEENANEKVEENPSESQDTNEEPPQDNNENNPQDPLEDKSSGRSSLLTHSDYTADTDEIKILYLPEDIPDTSFTPQTRIVGGKPVANREDFAYQASFRLRTGQHFCGAAIIDDMNILTAAHCVFDDNQKLLNAARLMIVVGDLNVMSSNEHTVIRTVQHIFPHPQYNYRTFQNDVAVLRVESLGNFTNYINKIELATETPEAGTPCIVSGWGKTSFSGQASAELRYVSVPIVSREECLIGYPNGILDGMLCAGLMEGGKDACQGDSGGPLVCDNKLAGIVSWGKDCALKNHPGVYTDVASYYSWIRQQQGKSNTNSLKTNTSFLFVITNALVSIVVSKIILLF